MRELPHHSPQGRGARDLHKPAPQAASGLIEKERRKTMPRLLGVDIPGKKQSRFALRYIHGIGPRRADDVLAACSIEPSKKADDLSQDEIHAITTFIQEHYRVEGDLRREVSQNIRRLISIGSYRGLRHKRGLPVRGQRTKTNAKTRKGGRRASAAVIRAAAPKK
jgi:small subunit ribosomal protein S13